MRSWISAILVFVLAGSLVQASDFGACDQQAPGAHRVHSSRTPVRSQAPVAPDVDVPAQVVCVLPLDPVGLVDCAKEPGSTSPSIFRNKPARAPPQFS
jgi:hypothetical protein